MNFKQAKRVVQRERDWPVGQNLHLVRGHLPGQGRNGFYLRYRPPESQSYKIITCHNLDSVQRLMDMSYLAFFNYNRLHDIPGLDWMNRKLESQGVRISLTPSGRYISYRTTPSGIFQTGTTQTMTQMVILLGLDSTYQAKYIRGTRVSQMVNYSTIEDEFFRRK